MASSDVYRNLPAILPNDREAIGRKVNLIPISKKLLFGKAFQSAMQQTNQFKDQAQAVFVTITQRMRTISESTRARIFGRMPSRDTKSTLRSSRPCNLI